MATDLQTAGPIRERFTKLFEFLKAFSDLQYPLVRHMDQQLGALWLGHIPAHASIELFRNEAVRAEGEATPDSGVVLRITRPDLTLCPPPPALLDDWIKPGWQKIDGKVELRVGPSKEGRKRTESFEADPQREEALRQWSGEREKWAKSERPVRRALALFQTVYEWFGVLEREGERVELLVGDGLFCWPHESGEFRHPVLFQKLELEFHSEKQQPQFIFRKREQPPELYREFLHALPGAHAQEIVRCDNELKEAEYPPLGGEETQEFLRRLILGLFPAGGEFCGPGQKPLNGPAGPFIERRPVIFMRHRRIGPGNVFDLVLADAAKRIETGEPFSSALMQILGLIEKTPPLSESEARVPALGNEDADVLLSKPANREQLEIARQLARRDCVLVQGPPGTGKTHTIANLLGHLLAQGKRVLVTAQTPKALRVLRDKVVEPLQPLCVSVLQNEKKSHEELQDSVRRISVRLSQDDRLLQQDAARLKEERAAILGELQAARQRLLEARQDETREIIFAGKAVRPVEAAKLVKAGQGKDDWIPSPIVLGEGLPVPATDVIALYQSNARVSLTDERELGGVRPDLAQFPSPLEFQRVVVEMRSLAALELRFGEELWIDTGEPQDLTEFARMLEMTGKAIEFFKDSAAWQLEAVQAGRDGEPARRTWESLADFIEQTWQEIHECHALVMEHGPEVSDPRPARALMPVVDEMIEYVAEGGRFTVMTRLTKRHWAALAGTIRINGREPDLNKTEDLRAVRAQLRIAQLREELCGRWERMMTAGGAPPVAELGNRPEQACRGFVSQIRGCIEWHQSAWKPLEEEFGRLGFNWPAYLESTPPEVGDHAGLRRLRSAVMGALGNILQTRAWLLRLRQIQELLAGWQNLCPQTENEALATQRLRQALQDANAEGYQSAYNDLARLQALGPEAQKRVEWLSGLARSAPAWASAIQNRLPGHDQPQPPGSPEAAWQWRQLQDELERRAAISLEQLQERIEEFSGRFLKLTTELVEKQTWSHQIRTVTPEQKQALGAYVALRNRVTKSGVGKKDAAFRSAARREMALAKSAVPVWIMPLNEVAETFDPRTTRFDVVIIDEASQCDPSAMFALYLGRQTVIVGDDEQVTPVTVGLRAEEVMKLIHGYLDGIPRKELYDGQTSVYEFGQWAFGGVIRLVEHFRCAPDIIAFSNSLSYRGEIKPLREESTVKLKPHVVPFWIEPAAVKLDDDVNMAEAEAVASLICAAIKQPEYAANELGQPMTFGVVCLVGEEQALTIDRLLRTRVPAEEYQLRQILCGSPAQLQGDERDVVFLSLVDAPVGAPLPLRDPDVQQKMFKRRFNVAASRARDQMWVVYTLHPHKDLKPGDIRRQLIEHALDPKSWARELEKRLAKAEENSEAFAGTVRRRLEERGFTVQQQVPVGAYRIDLVVTGGGRRLAVECDGESWQSMDQLREDMERQAILERLGWKFARIRGSVFFRDPDRALEPVFQRLEELGIAPESATVKEAKDRNGVEARIIRRAEELRRAWKKEAETGGMPMPGQSEVKVVTGRQ